MTETIAVYKFWITDERTGKRRRTAWHMTAEDALARYPGAERDEATKEVRSGPSMGAGIVVTQHLKDAG